MREGLLLASPSGDRIDHSEEGPPSRQILPTTPRRDGESLPQDVQGPTEDVDDLSIMRTSRPRGLGSFSGHVCRWEGRSAFVAQQEHVQHLGR